MLFEDKVKKLRIEKHKGRETEAFLNDVKQMCEGKSFEYLMGVVDFCGAKIDLSYKPMIPRPETEFWVSCVIENIPAQARPVRVLDLFAGSGCVGLAVLKNISNSQVTFVEIDKRSKNQIEISLDRNKIDRGRSEIIIEDCVRFLQNKNGQKFDMAFIVPPYVPPHLKDEVMQELHQEEELFFFDKEDGFFYMKEVLSNISNILNEGGELFMEFDITQRQKIEELVLEKGFKNYGFLKDPHGHECVIFLKSL